jgi:hypothetical protein
MSNCEEQNRRLTSAGLPGNFRPGDWICPGCSDHKFAYREICEKCNTPKPVDALGATISQASSTAHGGASSAGAVALDEACLLATAIGRIEFGFVSPVSESTCALRPVRSAELLAILEPISSCVLRSLQTNCAETLAQMERECNPYQNGIDAMPITAATLEWVTLPTDNLMIHMLATSESVRSRASAGLDAGETVNAEACAVEPLSGHRPTRSPLLVFKMANAEREVVSVAVHVGLTGRDLEGLQPEDAQYFYIEIARFSATSM